MQKFFQNHPVWSFLLAALMALLIFSIVVVLAIRETTLDLVSPLTQANQSLNTQVAEFLHPTPTIIPDPVTIIHAVRSLARLETIHYSVEKIITAEVGQDELKFLFGDKLLFVAHGYVIAGIDLQKMETKDMVFKDGALQVTLPETEIFVATLDNDLSYVYDRETGLFRRNDIELETKARQAAEAAIQAAALDDGILEQARTNAENYLSRLLSSLGYNQVLFVTQ
ncbi:MAG: hypothetical protein CVU39_03970 [Chloroflexi bacterium HGW-Chloroflexi-10]|nr:MAG: hypothetical protein CVU39_03970 [Chloroflexi bacterium HGW-Chloroflexi-10]